MLACAFLLLAFVQSQLELVAPEPALENRAKKTAEQLKEMRFFIWHPTRRPFLQDSKATVTVGKKKLQTFGAEVIDPVMQKSKVYDNSLPTFLNIHGFNAQAPVGGTDLVMMALEKRKEKYNVIALDWRQLASWQGGIDGYDVPANNVFPAGIRAADMLAAMVKDGTITNFEQIHLSGHSLGAHVGGQMARRLRTLVGKNITHFTALDPAGPKFVDDKDVKWAMKITDANYIDAVHTDGAINRPFVLRGHLGDARPDLAHANFYLNGGKTQPGCKPTFGLCSHQRAFHYYAEAVLNQKAFRGYRCDLIPGKGKKPWHKMASQGCLKKKISDKSVSAYIEMNYETKPRGNYLVETNKKYPYSNPAWNNIQ